MVCGEQKQQLLRLNVLELFMLVSLDDGTVPPIKYQYAELSKLYAVVSQLVRCCDVSDSCHSSCSVSSLKEEVFLTFAVLVCFQSS